MARKVVVELVDDIDGTVFGEDGESITFSVNGVDYEIDLKGKHASKFHKQIGFFIEHATRVGGRKRRSDRFVVADARCGGAGTPRRSAPGRSNRATKSLRAGAFRPTSSRRSRRALTPLRRTACTATLRPVPACTLNSSQPLPQWDMSSPQVDESIRPPVRCWG